MTASSSNIGSIAKRLVLTIWRSGTVSAVPSAILRRSFFSSSGLARTRGFSLKSIACRSTLSTTTSSAAWYEAPDAWLLSVLPSMTSVTSAMWASRRAAVGLVRQLDDGVRAVIEEPLEAGELALRVLPDPVRDLEVLAPDDRPHG